MLTHLTSESTLSPTSDEAGLLLPVTTSQPTEISTLCDEVVCDLGFVCIVLPMSDSGTTVSYQRSSSDGRSISETGDSVVPSVAGDSVVPSVEIQ